MSILLINSLIGGLLAGGLCGSIGMICNRLNLSTIAFATAHAALAGSALALALGLDITSTAMVFALITAIILGPLADRFGISLDLMAMTLFSAYNALAFIFIVLAPGSALMTESVGQLLWGSILAIRPSYLAFLSAATIFSIIFLTAFWGRINSILFDSKLAEAEGVNVSLYKYVILTLVGSIIALTLRITGGFLVFSLLYLPAAASIQLHNNMKNLVISSWILGSISAAGGLGLSFIADLPAGSCITIAAILFFLGSIAYSRLRILLGGRGLDED
ncbi:MAG: metal ABC transporter permease [Thaumarchaeota archaeon]|nr:metal ABC transporter permease [Nitrososphaerota archaeon]